MFRRIAHFSLFLFCVTAIELVATKHKEYVCPSVEHKANGKKKHERDNFYKEASGKSKQKACKKRIVNEEQTEATIKSNSWQPDSMEIVDGKWNYNRIEKGCKNSHKEHPKHNKKHKNFTRKPKRIKTQFTQPPEPIFYPQFKSGKWN